MTDPRPSIAELQAAAATGYGWPNAAAIAINHAVPVLLEIAAAALRLDVAERALTAAKEAGRPHQQELREAAACLAEHDAAIAKVRP